MNIALWIVQGLLAFVFLMAGIMKLSQPREKLLERNMQFVEDLSDGQVRGIGTSEVLGAIGLILPALTGILVFLTPLAAVGLILVMLGAALTHLRRNEPQMIVGNVVLLALAAFVAYGRFVVTPL